MSEKTVQYYYKKIENELKKYDDKLYREFLEKKRKEMPRDIFIWLDGLCRLGNIPKSFEPFVTELFWLIH